MEGLPQENSQKLAIIANDILYIKKEVSELNEKLGHKYVTQDQFDPIKRIVYGMVGVVLVSFVGAIIALILK